MSRATTQHMNFPKADTADDLTRNIAAVKMRIAAACRRVGRDPHSVRLLPVSKTVDERHIRLAYEAGCRAFGENKVQEARTKAEAMADLDIAWSVIGYLQSNKAKYVARFAAEFQALDSLKAAEGLDRRLNIEGRALDVFIQVNSSGEASKYGVTREYDFDFARQLSAFSTLKVRGLMTLAVFSADSKRVRRCFMLMRRPQDQLKQEAPAGMSFGESSMGMSGDFEIAIEEGATTVRVGQAIGGARRCPTVIIGPQIINRHCQSFSAMLMTPNATAGVLCWLMRGQTKDSSWISISLWMRCCSSMNM